MSLESAYLLALLLGSVGILVVSGMGSLLLGRRSERGSVALGAAGAVMACGMGLVAAVVALVWRTEGTGSWPWSLPYGSFRLGLDPLSSFFLIPMFLLAGLVAVYSIGYFKPWQGRNPGRFWFFYNALVASMALVLTAQNGVLFLVAWEAMSLASFFLVISDDDKAGAREAGWIYLVAMHIGTAFLLALFMLLGRASGSQNFSRFAASEGSAGLLFLLALIGFGTKAGLFPLHVWLPEAHPAAPSPVSALMSGVMIKTGIYGIVRTLVILGPVPGWCAWLVLGVGAVSGILGVLFALAQHDIKRLLAYHSVENIGIIALGLGLGMLGLHYGSPAVAALGFAGGLLHVLNHAMFKGLLFLGAGAVAQATGTRQIEQLGGLLKRMPGTGGAFLVGSVAICGLPPFNGFASEFLIYMGAFTNVLGHSPLALAGIASLLSLTLIGGLATACFTKAFGIVFLGEPRAPGAATAHDAEATMRGPMFVLATLCLVIGLAAGFTVRLMEPAVAMLSGPVAAATGAATRWIFPVSFCAVLLALIGLVLMLVVVRRGLLVRRPMRETVTWDCGYAAPAVRMQYTATGFAQPLTHGAQAILQPQVECHLPSGIYPASAAFHSHTPDVAQERLFGPVFRRVARFLGRLRWMQQGQVHLYILYIAITLMALLAWALRS